MIGRRDAPVKESVPLWNHDENTPKTARCQALLCPLRSKMFDRRQSANAQNEVSELHVRMKLCFSRSQSEFCGETNGAPQNAVLKSSSVFTFRKLPRKDLLEGPPMSNMYEPNVGKLQCIHAFPLGERYWRETYHTCEILCRVR